MIERRRWRGYYGHGTYQVHVLVCPVCRREIRAAAEDLVYPLMRDHVSNAHPGTEIPSLEDVQDVTEGYFDAGPLHVPGSQRRFA